MAQRSRLINKGALTREVNQRVNQLRRDSDTARFAGARVATDKSRQVFRSRLSGRATVPPRPGRPTTQGRFDSYISWRPVGESDVELNMNVLQTVAPYWIIQEIGTGTSAQMMRGGQGQQRQRGKQGSVRVKSQKGRPIARTLEWSGPAPTGQLVLGRSAFPGQPRIRIMREIKGKHYVRQGGRQGFQVFRSSLLGAARKTFTR